MVSDDCSLVASDDRGQIVSDDCSQVASDDRGQIASDDCWKIASDDWEVEWREQLFFNSENNSLGLFKFLSR